MIQICSDKHQVLQVYPVITETWFQCLPKIILAEYVDTVYKEKKKKSDVQFLILHTKMY